MNSGICISALASSSGKTLITLSILRKLADLADKDKDVQAFKIGPDYIDPQFHEKASYKPSINLDLFMMQEDEMQKIFLHYSRGKLPVLEGVMGFYDGIEEGFSTYDVAKALKIPTVLIILAGGLYSTVAALIHGMLTYRKDNTIKGVILNHITSKSHFDRINDIIKREFPFLKVLGFVKKENVEYTKSRHLGLDLNDLYKTDFAKLADKICCNLDMKSILEIIGKKENTQAPLFSYINAQTQSRLSKQKISIVYDKAFSFLYHDNKEYLKQIFKTAYFVSALDNEEIPSDSDIVYIPGGYVETKELSEKLRLATKFRDSLKSLSNTKRIYAECAGLIYLSKYIIDESGNKLDMADILPLSFAMRKTRKRLGYYLAFDKKSKDTYKGHAFHYSEPYNTKGAIELMELYKKKSSDKREPGVWTNKTNNIVGTYLHTMLRLNPHIIANYF